MQYQLNAVRGESAISEEGVEEGWGEEGEKHNLCHGAQILFFFFFTNFEYQFL
jgi:hypothetical protein